MRKAAIGISDTPNVCFGYPSCHAILNSKKNYTTMIMIESYNMRRSYVTLIHKQLLTKKNIISEYI